MRTSTWICVLCSLLLCGCRGEVVVYPPEEEQHGETQLTDALGFYLLNEGNMGSNKATLDYYDFTSATYRRNIYAEANPNVAKELGDVGNDLKIYGGRLYAVINCSNKVEVMDARTCRRIGQIDVPNCRYLRFHGGEGYLTSYAGPVVIKPDYEQLGYVARFDTATLAITGECLVGFQPDELEIAGGKLYVANSGGYMVPNYENTVSVIDLTTFTETKRIPVAVNLHHLRADRHGQLWVSSRGDYYNTPSRLYCIDTQTDQVTDSVDMAVSNFWLDGDSLYCYSTEWSYIDMETKPSHNYCIIDVKSHRPVTDNFITDGTDQKIKTPYGISVHPLTKDIYVTDAKNYVTPGTLWCFSPEGEARWSVRTGDIPAHFAFLYKSGQ
ncbi:MAG: YncE family protein [Paludibacteraceae bacterium]|nr:YncE family protein [Paludibacteraceae bacterium]